jgi:ribosomal protein L27
MKKLLLTTAIAGVMVSGSAFAQTTITGELRLNYKALGNVATGSGAAPSTGAVNGFGQEQQINIQTKGKLNVLGLDYAAGMSLENDGAQSTTLFNENTYMDFTNASSGTTLSIGRDHVQRSDSDRSAAVLVGFTPNELSTDGPTSARTIFSQNIGPATGQAIGATILQKTPIGTFNYTYAPSGNADQATRASSNTSNFGSEAASENDEESAYEYGFTGDFGVKGLNTYYFKSAQKKSNGVSTQTRDADARSIGVSYNMGQFSVGYADKKYNFIKTSGSTGSTAGTNDITEKHYGVAYAVNNTLSVGAIYAKGDFSGSTATQKTKGVNIGYNLGPVAMTVGYAQNTDIGGTAGAENNQGMIRFIGAF